MIEDKNRRRRGFYVLEFDNGIKVGVSDNFDERLKTYRSPWIRDIISSYFLETGDCYHIERQMTKFFKKNITTNHSYEFISGVNVQDVIDTLKSIMITSRLSKKDLFKNTVTKKGKWDW